MTTVLSPLNQAIQPYVFRGGGENRNKNKSDQQNVFSNSNSVLKTPSNCSTMKVVSDGGGLDMIYEEDAESCHLDTATNHSRPRPNCLIGNGNNNDSLLQQASCSSLSPSPSILRRSRSLPQDEFRILGHKLCELQRNDSIVSGRSGRDSGFNTEHPSCTYCNSIMGFTDDFNSFDAGACIINNLSQGPAAGVASNNGGVDIPSEILGSELPSGFLEHYGLDGPLDVYPDEGDDEKEAIERRSRGDRFDRIGNAPIASVTSVNTKKKRKEELKQATIRQHYYPEGGWGYIVVTVAFLVQVIAHGFQMAIGILILWIMQRWGKDRFIESVWLGSLCMSVSLFLSPITIGICRKKSTRLTAVIGGLVIALGCLFTSFANQFHQMYFSLGIMLGVGVGMTRDTSTLMVAQYFKRKREFVEIIILSASGVGLAVSSLFLNGAIGYSRPITVGWRLGLQAVTGVLFITFLLGTFYRSASLYHPQRRAILHLKTQKRKIKNKDKEKNKLQDDTPPFFDFNTLKSRTVQIILMSVSLTHFGIYTPLFLIAKQGEDEGMDRETSVIRLQIFLGIAWCIGCCTFGLVIVNNSVECRIGRQYLCQASLLLTSLSIFAFTKIKGYNGYIMFVWMYGIFIGGYAYSLKMYIYEKVRARNFARAWGFAQCSMAIPLLVGVPISGYISNSYNSEKAGYYFSAICVFLGCLTLSLVDIHKKQLRKKRRLRHSRSTASTCTSATTTTFRSSSSGFARLGSSASSSASRSLVSSSSTRGRRNRRRNLTSSVGTNSTYCGPSGATNNNSLVLVDEMSHHSNSGILVGVKPSQQKSIKSGHLGKLTKQGSTGVNIEPENMSSNSYSNSIILKSPKSAIENKTSSFCNLASSDSLIKLNSPSLPRKTDSVNNIADGNKLLVIDQSLKMLSAIEPNVKEKCVQQQKQAIQMNVLGLGTTLKDSDEKEIIDADEIKIDYRFGNEEVQSSLGITPSQLTTEMEMDPQRQLMPKSEKNKFRRYISMDMEGEEEFYDDELAIDDDDYDHDYDEHEEFMDDDDDEDDGEEVYHVGNLDDLEYLENITSCNKVENVVMLSEFEQNLQLDVANSDSGIHAASTGASHPSYNKMYKTKRGKRWSMFHGDHKKDHKTGGMKNRGGVKDHLTPPRSSETNKHRNKKWNQVLPGPSRAITTIEENSSS